jgi:hypothetical protein
VTPPVTPDKAIKTTTDRVCYADFCFIRCSSLFFHPLP